MKRTRAILVALAPILAALIFSSCNTALYANDPALNPDEPILNPVEPVFNETAEQIDEQSAADVSQLSFEADESSARAEKDESSKRVFTTSKPKKEKLNPNAKASFFDDAVFVGDSVTLGLKNIATSQRNAGKNYLGKAKFLCSGSLGYSNSAWDTSDPKSVHPKLNGKKVRVEDGVKTLGAKKLFIMLGMNDFAAYDHDVVIKKATALINKIIEKSPGIKVYVESVTPITADKQHGKFNNKNVDAFNAKLKAMCQKNGWTYVDINSQFKDENGNLHTSYCGDLNGMGIHMAKKGCDKWVDYLIKKFSS